MPYALCLMPYALCLMPYAPKISMSFNLLEQLPLVFPISLYYVLLILAPITFVRSAP
ncbi:protein of unknown function [Vibrio tapetis subsp. tapetis]|uniref:Uncharacterized protein n=1 Tax=Vibrio tapetis subsp. tapetis TaxID=1671868 RepID=A0A2N8ZKP0_9VIBR|nr:protein of unknown function [Vibrio tapetis subsp. tapetis]